MSSWFGAKTKQQQQTIKKKITDIERERIASSCFEQSKTVLYLNIYISMNELLTDA